MQFRLTSIIPDSNLNSFCSSNVLMVSISHLGNLRIQNTMLLNNNKRIITILLLLYSFESTTLTDVIFDTLKRKGVKWKKSQKTTYHYMISFIWKIQNKQIHRDRSLVVAYGRARGKWGVIFNGFGVSLWDDETMLKLDSGDGCTTL